MTRRVTQMDRATFIRQAGGMLAVALVAPVRLDRLAPAASLEHPEPREGITGERVLTAEALGRFANRTKVMECYDGARAHPAIFDGVACACSCGGKKAEHRSLLVCFETMQATGCGACTEEAEVVLKALEEGKSLADVRAAVDKWNS